MADVVKMYRPMNTLMQKIFMFKVSTVPPNQTRQTVVFVLDWGPGEEATMYFYPSETATNKTGRADQLVLCS